MRERIPGGLQLGCVERLGHEGAIAGEQEIAGGNVDRVAGDLDNLSAVLGFQVADENRGFLGVAGSGTVKEVAAVGQEPGKPLGVLLAGRVELRYGRWGSARRRYAK